MALAHGDTMSAWIVAIAVSLSVITVNVYLIWANKRNVEHDTIQRKADEP